MEKLLDPKITLEMTRIKRVEMIVKAFSIAGLCKCKVFVVSKLTEILCNYIFEII